MGTRNASVLPEPVFAFPNKSRPSSNGGMARSWIFVMVPKPIFLMLSCVPSASGKASKASVPNMLAAFASVFGGGASASASSSAGAVGGAGSSSPGSASAAFFFAFLAFFFLAARDWPPASGSAAPSSLRFRSLASFFLRFASLRAALAAAASMLCWSAPRGCRSSRRYWLSGVDAALFALFELMRCCRGRAERRRRAWMGFGEGQCFFCGN